MTVADARAAYAKYLAASDEAALTGRDALVLPLVSGAAYDTLQVQYALLGLDQIRPPYARYTYGTPTFYLTEPSAAGQSQYFVVSVVRTRVTGGLEAPSVQDVAAGVQFPATGRVLMLFERSASGGSWQLQSVSQLAPGQAVPALATDSRGYVLPMSMTSRGGTELVRPALTPPLQATVVDDGPESPASQVVAAGPLTTGLYQVASTSARDISAPHGDIYQWLLEGSSYGRLALQTADGGALVLYAMYFNTTVETQSALNQDIPVQAGPPISVPSYVLPLLPPDRTAPRKRLQTQDVLTFAAIDPPASVNGAKIQVIAIGGGLYEASASLSGGYKPTPQTPTRCGSRRSIRLRREEALRSSGPPPRLA
jgi:hypothetical protein